MSPLTVVKIALAAVGLLVFGYGVRVESAAIRWAGIAVVAAAAMLRFVKPRPPAGGAGREPGEREDR
ncbi:MAG: hypothetical protein ACJ79S_00630 [Gemmatimonadaceae bacterium]